MRSRFGLLLTFSMCLTGLIAGCGGGSASQTSTATTQSTETVSAGGISGYGGYGHGWASPISPVLQAPEETPTPSPTPLIPPPAPPANAQAVELPTGYCKASIYSAIVAGGGQNLNIVIATSRDSTQQVIVNVQTVGKMRPGAYSMLPQGVRPSMWPNVTYFTGGPQQGYYAQTGTIHVEAIKDDVVHFRLENVVLTPIMGTGDPVTISGSGATTEPIERW